jgi:AcrR family transcriptional regulator
MKADVRSVRSRPYRSEVRAAAAVETGDRILEAAIERFSTEPYESVALEDVAQDADVAVRTVIRRFGSKDDLFVAAGVRVGERMQAQRDQAPVGDVRAVVRNLLDHYEEWGDQRLLLIAQEHRIPAVRRHTQEGRAYHRRWVERALAPLLDPERPRAHERQVLALVAATDVYVWKLLRRDLGLSRSETEHVIATLIGTATERGT